MDLRAKHANIAGGKRSCTAGLTLSRRLLIDSDLAYHGANASVRQPQEIIRPKLQNLARLNGRTHVRAKRRLTGE
jgi:hypothetical protein